MCGRFEQSGTRRYYAAALGVDTSNSLDWLGDHFGRYNVYPTLYPWMILLHKGKLEFAGKRWEYRTPEEQGEPKTLDQCPDREGFNRALFPPHVSGGEGNHS